MNNQIQPSDLYQYNGWHRRDMTESEVEVYGQIVRYLLLHGDKFPKKHGEWRRVHVYGNHWLLLDSHNGYVHHFTGSCEPHDTDNLYRVVYCFYGTGGEKIENRMISFWWAHLQTSGK